MSNKEQDFLLFYDWYRQLMNMSAKNCQTLLRAMVEYQIHGTAPPDFPDNIKGIAELMLAQVSRRIAAQENGKKGGEARIRELVRKSAEAEKAARLASGTLEAPPKAPLEGCFKL